MKKGKTKKTFRIKHFLVFLVFSLISAFIFEELPRTLLKNLPGVLHLWELGSPWYSFLPWFILWYGGIFAIFYFLFINRPIKYVVIFGVIFGLLAETFWFKKMENIISFILFVILYGLMFYLPFKIMQLLDKKKVLKK